MAKKRKDMFYFENFTSCASLACDAANMLKGILENFKPEDLSEKIDAIHTIEHNADVKKHEVMDALAKEFIAPIEREDIVELSHNIDEIVDRLEDVLIRIYINNIQEIQQDAIEMMKVIIKCCEEVQGMLEEFADFKRSKTLKEKVIRINAMEEEADRLYIAAMRKLHVECKDALHIIAWREIYDYFEKCADACEHTANVVESVVMKNT